MIIPSKKIQMLPGYAFAEMDKLVSGLKAEGTNVIDFGTGDPRDETPEFVREAAKKAIGANKTSGYPSYIGMPEFRNAIAEWYSRRCGVTLDPETEITSTIGSKEAIFNFPNAFLETGDIVIMPTPGYPPYMRGTIFAGGTPWMYPLIAENNFFPDFAAIPPDIIKKAKILWICYPNSPTGKLATREFYEQAAAFCQKHNLILASDECYIDIYFNEPAISALQISKKNIVAFHSLSKRNNMTGYRTGFVCGDPDIIGIFKKLKTNIDSGTPNFLQEAAIAALKDDSHAKKMRSIYRARRDIMCEALRALGLTVREPEGTFYIWQRTPKGYTGISFAARLLKDCAIAVTPGEWLSDTLADGNNPGANYVRFALVEPEDRVKEAAQKLANLKL